MARKDFCWRSCFNCVALAFMLIALERLRSVRHDARRARERQATK